MSKPPKPYTETALLLLDYNEQSVQFKRSASGRHNITKASLEEIFKLIDWEDDKGEMGESPEVDR